MGDIVQDASLGLVKKEDVTSFIGDFTGANAAGRAAGEMAQAQLQASREQLDFEKKSRQQALQLAKPSYEELSAINQQFQMSRDLMSKQLENLQTEHELLSATDPALKAAAMEAYNLVQGKQSSAISPMLKLREQQRNQLENQLRDKLGSGYQESSSGQEALNQFDVQTANYSAQIQQSTMGQLLNLTASVRPNMVNETGNAYAGASNIASSGLAATQNISSRQVGAITGTPVNYQNVISTAGAPYAGDYYAARSQQNTMNQLMNGAITFGAAMA